MQEFLSMGGYGAYVWPSYILSAVLMVGILVASVRSLKSTESTFERLKAETGTGEANKEETETPNGDEA